MIFYVELILTQYGSSLNTHLFLWFQNKLLSIFDMKIPCAFGRLLTSEFRLYHILVRCRFLQLLSVETCSTPTYDWPWNPQTPVAVIDKQNICPIVNVANRASNQPEFSENDLHFSMLCDYINHSMLYKKLILKRYILNVTPWYLYWSLWIDSFGFFFNAMKNLVTPNSLILTRG